MNLIFELDAIWLFTCARMDHPKIMSSLLFVNCNCHLTTPLYRIYTSEYSITYCTIMAWCTWNSPMKCGSFHKYLHVLKTMSIKQRTLSTPNMLQFSKLSFDYYERHKTPFNHSLHWRESIKFQSLANTHICVWKTINNNNKHMEPREWILFIHSKAVIASNFGFLMQKCKHSFTMRDKRCAKNGFQIFSFCNLLITFVWAGESNNGVDKNFVNR